MLLRGFKSLPKRTFFAPEWHYVMGEDMIDGIDYEKVAEIILSKEKGIIESTPGTIDGYTGLGNDSLTSRFRYFNVLQWEEPEIALVKEKLFEKYQLFLKTVGVTGPKVWIQCWANVLRNGQEIKPHIHSVFPTSYLGGHLCIQCNDTATVYINPINQINDPEVYSSKNEVGKFTIFQEAIPHYTTKHTGDKERITIAFDLMIEEYVQTLPEQVQSNLVLFNKD